LREVAPQQKRMNAWFKKATEVKKYTERELKVHLKTCLIRLGLRKTKSKNNIQRQRREISILLAKGDDENARILVEQIIKEEYRGEAFEELTVMCEELQARLAVITTSKRLPMDLKENICTIIWAAPQVDVKEFSLIRQQLALKYGLNLDHEATCNIDNCVNSKVVELLSPNPPEEVLVFSYLKEIANEYQVDWKPEELNLPSELPQNTENDELQSRLQNLTNFDDFDDFEEAKLPEVHQNLTSHSVDSPDLSRINLPTPPGPAPEALDDFESMFAPIPEQVLPVAIPVQNKLPTIQKVQPITPQRNIQTIQPIQTISLAKTENPTVQPAKETNSSALADFSVLQGESPLVPLKVDLAASRTPGSPLFISDKELEEEFEKMFGSAMSELDNQPAAPVNPTPAPAPVKTPVLPVDSLNASKLSFQQQDSKLTNESSSEYADLFSAPPISKDSLKPQGGVKLPGLGDLNAKVLKTTSTPSKIQPEVPVVIKSAPVLDSTPVVMPALPSASDIDADYSNLFDRLQTLNQNSGKPLQEPNQPVNQPINVPSQFSSISFGKYAPTAQTPASAPGFTQSSPFEVLSSISPGDLDKFSAFPFDTSKAPVQPSAGFQAPFTAQTSQPSPFEVIAPSSVSPADLDKFSAFPFDTPNFPGPQANVNSSKFPSAAGFPTQASPFEAPPSISPSDFDKFSAFPFDTPKAPVQTSAGFQGSSSVTAADLDKFSAFPFPHTPANNFSQATGFPQPQAAHNEESDDAWEAKFNDPFSKLVPSFAQFNPVPQTPIQPSQPQQWNQPSQFTFDSGAPGSASGISLNKDSAPATGILDEDDELLRRFAMLSGKR